MTPQKNIRQMRVFVGLVKYYMDVWARRSNLLQSLTVLTSTQETFKWTDVKQQALDKSRQVVARDTLLIYLYFNDIFDIHTNASGFQLGAVIIQSGKTNCLL